MVLSCALLNRGTHYCIGQPAIVVLRRVALSIRGSSYLRYIFAGGACKVGWRSSRPSVAACPHSYDQHHHAPPESSESMNDSGTYSSNGIVGTDGQWEA